MNLLKIKAFEIKMIVEKAAKEKRVLSSEEIKIITDATNVIQKQGEALVNENSIFDQNTIELEKMIFALSEVMNVAAGLQDCVSLTAKLNEITKSFRESTKSDLTTQE